LQYSLVSQRTPPTDRTKPVLRTGRNCWRLANASQAALLIDAAKYFANLEWALRQAEHSILIAGWDFDGRIRLCPDDDGCPRLGDLLRSLVEAKPQLQIHILVWSFAVVHAPGAPLPLLVGAPWQEHRRIHLRLDRQHPFYAAHHQKIVCIDDAIGFCGGIDLTVRRWDTCEHNEMHSHRVDPAGEAYSPVHDVQMAVTGEAARDLGDVVRHRWRWATGELLDRVDGVHSLWPDGLESEHADVPVAISRTMPGWGEAPAVAEIVALTIDMLSAAKHSIYIETQYFTSRVMRDWMERSLSAPDGPEIVVVARRASPGMLERLVMDSNCDRVVRRLRRADRHNRFRIFYPVVAGESGECEVLVHAKVMIVDDAVMRIGSANLNNRSMGLDTECDLAIEATDETKRQTIARARDRLLAEHLDVNPKVLEETMSTEGSLIRTIERLNRNTRGLRPLPEKRSGPMRSIPGTWLLDPSRPLEPRWWRRGRRVRT
jgi:phosphatidylserine/phosphatidylglycerophosphate/cardiolipin synthase-like enzyme